MTDVVNSGDEMAGATAVPFVLPGPAPARETAAGWAHWRRTRHEFVPATRLSLGQWRRLSPRQRTLHDLHRAATHANLPILETPMSAAVSRIMGSRIQTNALKHKPTTRAGLMINGGGYQGKTETACEVAAAFEDQWLALHRQINPDAVAGTRDLVATVAYVPTPVTATPKSVCEAILGFYGAPHRGMTRVPGRSMIVYRPGSERPSRSRVSVRRACGSADCDRSAQGAEADEGVRGAVVDDRVAGGDGARRG